jgi:hypothetical protein
MQNAFHSTLYENVLLLLRRLGGFFGVLVILWGGVMGLYTAC